VTWRWSLAGPDGSFISDHEVDLDKSEWQYEACTDVYGWLEHYAGPFSDRTVSEEQIVTAAGDWISQQMFGPIADYLLGHAPCSVRLVLAPAATDLTFLPLELARVDGHPLAVQRVSLVIDVRAPRDPSHPNGIAMGPRERPTGHPVRELAASGQAIELQTLQYGATRENLAEAVADGDGWDVVHLSGHGRAGRFMLERLDGSRDPVTGGELTELLSPLRGRVRLSPGSGLPAASLRSLRVPGKPHRARVTTRTMLT
jgi:hypothetical protein